MSYPDEKNKKWSGILCSLAPKELRIILITHKIDEVMAISDHVSILRNGKLINSSKLKQTTKIKIEEQIVGKKLPKLNIKRGIIERKKVLEEEMRKKLLRRKIQKDKKKMIERKIKWV